jgi:hypothetical protein
MAKTNDIISGVGGPVTEEILYLLCNGQKRMRNHELEKSWKSLELWTDGISGDEEIMSLSLMKSVIDRHAGRLDVARSRIEMDIIAEGLYKKVPLGANDWVAAYAYYEVFPILEMDVDLDGCDQLDAETAYGGGQGVVETGE